MLQDLRHFVLISRPVNVLISVLAFALSCYLALGKTFDFWMHEGFWGTALTIALVAATGYWINDVYDFRIDRVNRPGRTIVNALLSVKKVLTVYFIVTAGILLFSLGFLGYRNGLYHVSFINVLSVLLLFWYAAHLKRVSVAGNLVVSFLTALVLFLPVYIYPPGHLAPIWAVIFAFEITLIREITKDVEDIRGDLTYHLRTLPILIGINNTRRILYVLYGVFVASCWLPLSTERWENRAAYIVASLLLVQLPTLYLVRLLARASEPEDFGRQSRYLKWLMLTGMATLFFL
ncbi:MAG: geranylgeranylglycerol-phosphate geranylgeranyltransferase [Bacteroidia bacterium]